MKFLLARNYLQWSIFYIVAIYMICALENYQLLSGKTIEWLVYDQMLTNAEHSFFEIFSATAWFFSAILFFLMVWYSIKKRVSKLNTFWFSAFLILSVFALGEEISWGDHLFNYSHESAIAQINSQKETNLHNINAALVLGVSQESIFYRYLENPARILNYLFYVMLAYIWVCLPLIKIKTRFGKKPLLQTMPVPSTGLMIFFTVHAVIFIFIDVFLFNVGQVFEMFISLAAVIVAMDMMKKPIWNKE